MKNTCTPILLACLLWLSLPSHAVNLPSTEDSLAFAQADFHWREMGKGAQVGTANLTLFGRPAAISIVRYPMRQWKTQMSHAPRELSSSVDSIALRGRAAAAINGAYFNMKTFDPVTFFVCNHKIVGRHDQSMLKLSTGLMGVRGKQVYFEKYDSLQLEQYRKHYKWAIQCGPLLMLDGVGQEFAEVSFNTTNHPRSMIGTTPDGECMMVVVDGRLKGNAEGATMWELLAIARWLGMTNALNLDGGGSSTLWTAADGTINYPCDNRRYDHDGLRRLPNIVLIR